MRISDWSSDVCSSDLKVFAVGDDWQSIYRFAGSDITIFTQFEANFGACWQGRLEQTYRCNQLLADTAARFVQRIPAQITKTRSAERRVGKEWVSTCRSRWSPDP